MDSYRQSPGEDDIAYFNRLFPRKHYAKPIEVKPTQWPDCAEHTRPLLDELSRVSGLTFDSDRNTQKADAERWYKEFGGGVQLVEDAYNLHMQESLFIRSLASLIPAARTIKAKKVDPDNERERQKYLDWVE